MTDASRKYVMARRAGGGTDLSKATLSDGTIGLTTALTEGVWAINASQQIGIATATEQGLSADRFPVRFIISAAPADDSKETVHTVVKYWPLCNLAMKVVEFSRRPIENTTVIENLYRYYPDVDSVMWEFARSQANSKLKKAADPEMTTLSNSAYAILSLLVLTADQITAVVGFVDKIKTMALAKKIWPYLRVAADHVIQFRPHGVAPTATATASSEQLILHENCMNIKENYNRLVKRNGEEALSTGVYLTAAYGIGAMMMFGLYESFESQEYYTAFVQPLAGETTKYSIVGVRAPRGHAAPADLTVGDMIDITDMKLSRQLLEIGPALCMAAGINHYMFNHTTGGSVCTGTLLTLLAMFGVITNTQDRKTQELVTTVFYEALHPVNKRAIANLFFKRSRVTTASRVSSASIHCELRPDAFLTIRLQPQPAGAHKAYVCAAALKRVIQGGLAPVLPWASSINDCIQLCASVLHGGAESHIGAMYYTGRHGLTQSSSLDNYLPEMAAFMQALARNDTLTMSPHLSLETAARAAVGWTSLMKDLKGADYVTSDPESVKKFLASQGKVFASFDITKEEDWGKAAEMSQTAMRAITNALE